jgi:hypothetical protein
VPPFQYLPPSVAGANRANADQADADQRIGLAGQVEVQVTQQQDAQDGRRRVAADRASDYPARL